MKQQRRVIFYIDGFNFYYGLKRKQQWKRYYWIDIVRLCSQFLRQDEELVCVKYFTARPQNEGKRERQKTLMKVNKKLHGNKFKVIYGKYSRKIVTCRASCHERFEILEEKQTDVSIAIHVLEDYILNNCEKSVLISADSDLLPPVRSIKQLENQLKRKQHVEIMFPPNSFSSDIYNSGFTVKLLKEYKARFNKALMPYLVRFPDKDNVQIPPQWRDYLQRNSKSH